MKKIGFGSTKKIGFSIDGAVAKLVADFTTGTYKASGVTKSFDDVFTFNRAGKAWLVKDTGLVEYGIDVPRFDDGLLIEQSATNSFLNNLNIDLNKSDYINKVGGTITKAYSDDLKTNIFTLTKSTDSFLGIINTEFNNSYIKSMWVSGVNAADTASILGYYAVAGTTAVSNTFKRYSMQYDTTKTGGTGFYLADFRAGTATILKQFGYQIEVGNTPSSLIVTGSSPVTRPADFLSINNENLYGATITGDWDSTLQISIVDGQIVHTGYGRIRSLEIN